MYSGVYKIKKSFLRFGHLMRSYLLKSIAILAFINLPAFAEPTPLALKLMTSCMKQGYEGVAPAIGALFWKSPFIQNQHKFGNDSHAMVQLTKNLFWFNIDGTTFDITNSYLKVAKYLKPEDLGILVGSIIAFTNSGKTEPDVLLLKKQVGHTISQRIKTDQHKIKESIIKGLQSTISRQKNQIIALAHQLKKNKATQSPAWNFLDTLLEDPAPSTELVQEMKRTLCNPLEDSLQRDLQALLRPCEQICVNNKSLEQEKKGKHIANQFLNTNAGDSLFIYHDGSAEFSLCKAIIQAVQEEQSGLYPKGLTIDMLLAWLWRYAETPHDVKTYLESLATSLNKPANELFTWPDSSDQFSRKDYEDLKIKNAEEIQTLPLDHLLFAREGYNLYENPLPPEVKMISKMSYQAYNTQWYFDVSDCGESALRTVLNAFFNNPQTRQFDIEYIKSITRNPELICFYIKYNTAEKINTIQAHNDWASITSEIPGVAYRRDNVVEIAAGIQNMLRVINHLIPGITSFDELVQKLSINGIKVTWQSRMPIADADTINTITFKIVRPGSEEVEITWEFCPEHFSIQLQNDMKAHHMTEYQNTLEHRLTGIQDNTRQFPYVTLCALFGGHLKTLKYALNKETEKTDALILARFLQTADINALDYFSRSLVALIASAPNPEHLTRIMVKIIDSIPSDGYTFVKFFWNLFDFSHQTQIQLAEDLLLSIHNDFKKIQLLRRITELDIPTDLQSLQATKHLYEKIKEIVISLKQEWLKEEAVESIIGSEYGGVNPSQEKRNLLKPLYEWVLITLPTLKKEDSKESAQHIVLNNLYRILLNLEEMPTPEAIEFYTLVFKWISQTWPTLPYELMVKHINFCLSLDTIGPNTKEMLKPLFKANLLILYIAAAHPDDYLYIKRLASNLLAKKSVYGDVLSSEEWQQVEQLIH